MECQRGKIKGSVEENLVLKRWLESDRSWGFQEEKMGKKVWANLGCSELFSMAKAQIIFIGEKV